MTQNKGASQATGLSQAEPVSRLGPPGFDPSRVRFDSSELQLGKVAARWEKQYHYSDGRWGSTISGPAEETHKKLLAAKTIADIDALGLRNWISERCDLCDAEPDEWLEVGEEPDYEARWLNLCLPCAEHLGAIAMEARQGREVDDD